jgi:hypothetical protein
MRPRYRSWAELMRRAFEADVLACPRCGGRMVVLATLDDPAVIRRILTHLGLSLEPGEAAPGRRRPGRTSRQRDRWRPAPAMLREPVASAGMNRVCPRSDEVAVTRRWPAADQAKYAPRASGGVGGPGGAAYV